MIRPLPLAAGVLLTALAPIVSRSTDTRKARRVACILAGSMTLVLVLAELSCAWFAPTGISLVFGLPLEWASRDWHRTAPVINLVVATMAVAMAPAASHPPRTLRAMLVLVGLAVTFLSLDHALPLTLVWVVATIVVARELAYHDRMSGTQNARVFRSYHGCAVVVLVAGTAALLAGYTTLAATAWLIAIAVREAAMPVHGWLPALADRAPLGLIVAIVAPQPGVYAQLTVCNELSGGSLAHVFASIAAVTAVVAALLGTVQTSPRRAAAWLLVSQTGLVAFGLENVSPVGTTGAIAAWQVMALATSGFVMTIAALEARRGTLSLRESQGSFARTPRMATAFLIFGFASVALPMTLGFVAEDLLVQGSVDEYPLVGAAVVVATALNGINVMRCFFRLFSGAPHHQGEWDLTWREALVVSTVLAMLFAGGVVPEWFLPTPETGIHGH